MLLKIPSGSTSTSNFFVCRYYASSIAVNSIGAFGVSVIYEIYNLGWYLLSRINVITVRHNCPIDAAAFDA